MTVRQLLQTCRDEMHEIVILEEKRDTLRASLLPKAIRPQKATVQSSPSNLFDNVQAHIFDLNMAIERHSARMRRNEEKASRFIRTLKDPRYRQMLTLYYLSFNEETCRRSLYHWEQVARRMNYSVDSIFKCLDDMRDFFNKELPDTV